MCLVIDSDVRDGQMSHPIQQRSSDSRKANHYLRHFMELK